MGESEAVKKFSGRDALLRVRDGKPNTDAGHRVPTESGLQAQPKFFTASRPPDGNRARHLDFIRRPGLGFAALS